MAKIILMQDNSKNILADKGWEAMELILDQEMPQKKKRRFLIWWLFGGLLVLSAYMIFQFSVKEQGTPVVIADKTELSEPTNIEKQRNQKELATTSKKEKSINIARSEEEHYEVLESANKIEKVKLEETLVSIKETNNRDDKEVVKKVLPNKPVVKEKDIFRKDLEAISKSTNTVKVEQRDDTAIDNRIEDSNRKIETEEINSDQNSGSEVFRNFQNDEQKDIAIEEDDLNSNSETISVENLVDRSLRKLIEEPLTERLILAFDQLEPVYIFEEKAMDIIVVEEEMQSYWYGSFGSYLNWGPNVKLYGLDAQVDLGHSLSGILDLGLSMGLGSFRYAASTNEASAITAVGRTMISNNEAANVLNSSFSNASFVDLGLHGGWNISKNFKVRADAGYSYLFTAMFDDASETFGIGLDMTGTSGAPELDAQDVDVEGTKGAFSEFRYELNKKWFPYAGISMQAGLSNKVSVDLGYRKVFGNLFPSSSHPLSMDRIRIGIKYRFLYRPSKQ